MRGAAGLLVACVVLRVLAVAAYSEVPGRINSFAADSKYWWCTAWLNELQSPSVEYTGTAEPTDDENFKWICPDRCKSMPYFDIKTSFSFMVWQCEKTAEQKGAMIDFYKTTRVDRNYWTGNKAYRDQYDQTQLTNSPAIIVDPNNIASTFTPISKTLVKSVGDCKNDVKKWNHDAQITECSIATPHLDIFLSTTPYVDDALDTGYSLNNCRFEDKVNTYTSSCFQEVRTDIVSVKPSYVFFPTATARAAGKDNFCQVVDYKDTAKTELAAREAKTNAAWSSPPRYSKHSYALVKMPFEYTDEWYVDYLGTNIAGYERDVAFPTGETPGSGKIKETSLKTRKYEWACKKEVCPQFAWDEGYHEGICPLKYFYFAAKQYESKCSDAVCQKFKTPACWANVYSIASSPCAWQKLVAANSATDGFVNLQQMTPDAEYANRMQEYGGGSFEVTFPASMTASKRTEAGLVSDIGNGKVSIKANDKFRIALKYTHSCVLCLEAQGIRPGVWGVVATTVRKAEQVVVECKECAAYEYVKDHVCTACAVHQVRAAERDKCAACPASAPMRRGGDAPDANCTACAVLDYFNGADARGCIRLGSVTDGLRVRGLDVSVSGIDKIFGDSEVKEVRPKAYRALAPGVDWWLAVTEVLCDFTADAVSRAVQLSYRRWCGHREIVREQQAVLEIKGRSGFYLLKAENTPLGFAAIGGVCGATLRAAASGPFDLQCEDNRSLTLDISVVRKGDPARCTVCAGAFFTEACLPTYHPEMAREEAAYFASGAPLSSAGTCKQCNGRCLQENHYLSPGPLTCMWNASAQARVTGAASALPSAGLFYWYKQAPCKACVEAVLNSTHAMMVKQCGNKRTYRTWDADYTTVELTRSIPYIKTCCSKWGAGKKECTVPDGGSVADSVPDILVPANCKEALELEDFAPVHTTYCPPGWYVDKDCAERTPDAWLADCCKRCRACGPGQYKTEVYGACSGATFIDTEKRGCETSCLSNSYRKDGRCYRCEQCSTTGTGEHG